MQFRAQLDDLAGTRIVRLAGRLEREQVFELVRLCEEAPGPVRLDLADLVSAGAEGLEALALLRNRGVALVGTSPYLALQLEVVEEAHARHDVERAGIATDRQASKARKDNREDE